MARFELDRHISFIPPDGDFELMSYRMESSLKPIFLVDTLIEEWKSTKIKMNVKLKTNFKKKCIANDVCIHIPVPCDAENFKAECINGDPIYMPSKDEVEWFIGEVIGGK